MHTKQGGKRNNKSVNVHLLNKLYTNILYSSYLLLYTGLMAYIYFKLSSLGRVGKESAVSKPIPKSIDADSYQKPKSNLLGFSLFTRQLISSEKFRVLSSADRNMQLCIHWNRMSEKEKDEYNTEAEKV